MENNQNIEVIISSLNESLVNTVKSWRSGDNINGAKYFIESIQLVEKLLQFSNSKFIEVQPILSNLYYHLNKKDINALTDELEYEFLPFLNNLNKSE